ncbi:MAG: PHP domain-containing protein [Kofleriaceae bacterium]
MRFELHCHSTCSDGSEPPDRVAARAHERNVEVFALTDHDTCAGSAVTVPGARVVRGVEITCDDQGATVHVLAFDRGGQWTLLEERLAGVRTARTNRLKVMAARLEQRGIHIDISPLLAVAAQRAVGRPDLARAMVAAGAASSLKDAFTRHLYDGGPVDVPHSSLSIGDALEVGRAAGAAMSLAHPHLYDQRTPSLAKRFKPLGLTAIEAYYGPYDQRERARWIELADAHGMVCTGGSDWHGPEQAIAQPGVDLPPDRSDALLRWLE